MFLFFKGVILGVINQYIVTFLEYFVYCICVYVSVVGILEDSKRI